MTNATKIIQGINNALSSKAGQELVKPLFEEAHRQGIIKTTADFQQFKDDLTLYAFYSVILSDKKLFELFSDDIYMKLNEWITKEH